MTNEFLYLFQGKTMKNSLLQVAVFGLASTICVSAAADPWSAPGSGPNPFADCGVGAAIFQETKWAAATSNIIWDIGTTAVTSATLSPQTCSGKKIKAALFIRDTYEQLAEDISRGKGAHLKAALEIFDCGSAQREAVVGDVRARMGGVLATPGYAEKPHLEQAADLFGVLDQAAARSCGA